MKTEKSIPIKSKKEIDHLRRSGSILASIVEEIKRSLKSGVTAQEIDKQVEELINQNKARPAFKGYRGFPNCTCISFNQEVVHGIPNKRVLREGDIVSVDIGIIFDDYFSDMAFTAGIGNISEELEQLINVTKESLHKGVNEARVGNYLSDISFAIQSFAEGNNFSVVRDFVGHGIGKKLHEEPEIPNFGVPRSGPLLQEGMVFAIEPMLNIGTFETKILEDGWTVVTKDGKASAHFEHTVAITNSGPEILTEAKK